MLSTAAALIAVGGLALAGAGSASAHSAMVDGTAQCRPDGTVSVTWTVTNDYQLPVQVTQTSSTGGGSVTGLPVTIDAASSSSANTKATVQQVGITTGTSTAILGVHGVWSDGFTTDSGGTVTLPQDCGPTTTTVTPVAPVLTTSQACDVAGSITIAATEGVGYFFNGEPIAAGKHEGPLSGTVTAKALEGFELKGTSSWPVSVPAVVACESGGGESGGGESGGGSFVETTPAASSVPAEVSTPATSELAFTGVSPQTWTYGVGGGLALLVLGGAMSVTAARLRR
ncbi:MAG: hypothetical protein ABIO48_02095 [Pedococcus sp.]